MITKRKILYTSVLLANPWDFSIHADTGGHHNAGASLFVLVKELRV